MVVNFSTLLLVLPAIHEITHSTATTIDQAVAFVVLYVIVLLPVLVPVALASILGDRADRPLDATHRWVGRNARTIGTVIEGVFAVYLIIRGIRTIP
jgi:threonine/homoserine/homoserine lactone efflux protein